MPKIKIDDLSKIAAKRRRATELREGGARVKITVHMGTCGISAGADKIRKAVERLVETSGRQDLWVTTSGCAGLCSREPMMTVEVLGQAPVKYVDLTEAKVDEIFAKHVSTGEIVTRYALAQGMEQVA